MALTTVLEFGDNSVGRYSKQYLVADCRYLFKRDCGRFSPKGIARCEKLEVTIVAPGRQDLGLFEWFSSQGVQSGRLVMSMVADYQQSTEAEQELLFEDARCLSLSELYDTNGTHRRLLKLTILAEKLTIDNITF